MTKSHTVRMLFIIQIWIVAVSAYKCPTTNAICEVRARTNAGWVCGIQSTYNNLTFASFLGVPYSRQPVGSLRFKELQPAEPWEGYYDATAVGPICPQLEELYESLMTNKKSSEACIHANIYVPIKALPDNKGKKTRTKKTTGLPIVVYIHGGGFSVGSGDPDVNGPEYLVSENMIVVTFNYRLNVLGFMPIPSVIPGNNGFRDMITLLKWVKTNARNFGGNPDEVTLAGQSAGAVSAHLLTLSKATEGLYKRVVLMSGTGIRSFYTASPKFVNSTSQLLLSYLGINTTEPEEIYQQLIALPLETLMNATFKVQATYGFTYFAPVIEEQHENFTTVIDTDPEILLRNGQGKDIPLIIGVTNLEGSAFIPYYTKNNALAAIAVNPAIILPPDLAYKLEGDTLQDAIDNTVKRCFNNETPTVEKFVKCFTDFTIVYPAIKLAQTRASMNNSAPVYFYQFSYNSSCSLIKETKNISYDGAAHLDDLSFYFRTNSMENFTCFQNPSPREIAMRKQMVQYVKNFSSCNNPLCNVSSTWPAEASQLSVNYENIVEPDNIYYTDITDEQEDVVQYLDAFYNELYVTS